MEKSVVAAVTADNRKHGDALEPERVSIVFSYDLKEPIRIRLQRRESDGHGLGVPLAAATNRARPESRLKHFAKLLLGRH